MSGIFHRFENPDWQTDFDEVQAAEQFILRMEGPFTGIGVNNIVGYMHSTNGDRSDYPNIRFNHYYIQKNGINSGFFHQFNFNRDIKKFLRQHNRNASLLVQVPTLLKPKSRGSVLLRDSDPLSPPIIDPGYLQDPEDFRTLVRAANHALAMGDTPPMVEAGASLLRFDKEFCNNCTLGSNNGNFPWSYLIPLLSTSAGHPAGTTRMGMCPDCHLAVVDTKLKVHGIKGLRVADASIMPEIISGDTYAANIMIAQRAADFILQDVQVCSREKLDLKNETAGEIIFNMLSNVLQSN